MLTARHLATRTSNHSYGTSFEHACQSYFLSSHALALSRSGGKNDRGIDLAGYLPSPLSTRVHAQCKALNTPVGPAHVREFGGMLRSTRAKSDDRPLLGLYCSASGYSLKALEAALRALQEPAVLCDFVFLADKAEVRRVGVWANATARRLDGVEDLFALVCPSQSATPPSGFLKGFCLGLNVAHYLRSKSDPQQLRINCVPKQPWRSIKSGLSDTAETSSEYCCCYRRL